MQRKGCSFKERLCLSLAFQGSESLKRVERKVPDSLSCMPWKWMLRTFLSPSWLGFTCHSFYTNFFLSFNYFFDNMFFFFKVCCLGLADVLQQKFSALGLTVVDISVQTKNSSWRFLFFLCNYFKLTFEKTGRWLWHNETWDKKQTKG